MADMDPKAINDLTNSVERLAKVFESFSKAGVNLGSNLSIIEKKMLDVAKAIGKSKKNIDKEEKSLKNVDKALELLSKSSSEQEKALDKMGKADQRVIKAMLSNSRSALISLKKDHQRRVAENQKAINEMISQEKKLSLNLSKEGKKRESFSSKESKIRGTGWGRARRRDPFGYLETTPKTKIEMMRKGGAATGAFKDISQMFQRSFPKSQASLNPFSAAQRFYQSRQALKSGATQIGQWKHVTGTGARVARAKALGGGGKQYAAAAKGLSALSGALGGLLKVLPVIGIIVSLASALSGIVKAAINAEDFISKLNKSFLDLAGPAIGLNNVSRYMKEFNGEVYNLRRNLKLGLRAKDIQEMFGALSAAGMSLQGVKQNVGSYGKVIYDARVLSLEFGTSIQDMGKMIGDNMMNLRTSIENVGDSFRKMAYDATIAGISSQKFYQIVESATSSLSFFGNFLKTGSSLLRSFYKAGELGLKDAESAVSGIMNAFKDVDYKKGLKILQTMGKEAVENIFGELTLIDKQNLEKLRNELESKLKIDTSGMSEKDRRALSENIISLRNQIESSEAKTDRLAGALSAYKQGSPEKLALQTGRLAQVPLKPLLKTMSLGNGYILAEIELLGQIYGLNQKEVVILKDTLERTQSSFTKFSSENKEIFKALSGNEEASKTLIGIIDKLEAGGDPAELLSSMSEALKGTGLDPKIFQELVLDLREVVENKMGKAAKDYISAVGRGQSTAGITTNIADYVADAVQKSDVFTGKKTEETNDWLKEVVGKVTSAKDYYEISKEVAGKMISDPLSTGIKWLTSLVASILGHVEDIAAIFRKDKSESVSDIQVAVKSLLENRGKHEKQMSTYERQFQEAFKIAFDKDISKEQAADLLSGKSISETDITGVDIGAYTNFLKNNKESLSRLTGAYDRETKSIGKINEELEKKGSDMAKRGHQMPFQEMMSGKYKPEEKQSPYSNEFGTLTKGFLSSMSLKQDFRANRGGLALLNRGDLVFKPPMAAGIAGGSGDFTPQILKDLFASPTLKGGGTKSIKYEVNLGGLTIQGDASDPSSMRKIADNLGVMINQAISKRERESQLAGG